MKSTLGLSALAVLMSATAALAEFPEKPVEFVVPFPPGDLEDILTRMIADQFQNMYGVPAAVVNKPGGGGGPFPGAVEVAGAPADGYTVGSFVIDIPVVGPTIGIPELDPNPFEPVGIFLTYPFVIATLASQPYDTWEELAAYGKDNDVSLGHYGSFLAPTQVTFAAAQKTGWDFSSEAAFDLLDCNVLASGDVDVVNATLQTLLPCIDDLKILASIGENRTSLTPDTPTIAEIVPELTLSLWNGLFVPTGTPQDARDKIEAAAKAALETEAAQALSRDTGALLYWKDAAQSAAQIDSDSAVNAEIQDLLQ
ncbi:MAG: tripartite tricarboxylate transporter substrate binding protein [Maritimibacter sp.]|nr:tripartite tricarboxylate transporter substrate binding protein [Maritimibacter sp.]